MKKAEVQKILFDEICKMPVVDTHEHLLWNDNARNSDGNDVLSEYLIHYMSSDIISSGMKRADFDKVTDSRGDVAERWKIVEPFWEFCRYTGYGRSLDIAVKAIYGIDGIYGTTIEELNKAFTENKKSGHYKHVLQDLCNIETSLLDVGWFRFDGEGGTMKRVWQPGGYYMNDEPDGRDIFAYFKDVLSIEIKSLDDWLCAFETELDYFIKTYNMHVLKSAIAYSRTLKFDKVPYSDAKALFAKSLANRNAETDEKKRKLKIPHDLQNYIMHHILKCADKRNMTYQFHTGHLEGNGNSIYRSDPSLLTNLFFEYPNVTFDLFHISYPYQNLASSLAKMFPNVTIDMCWAHIMSSPASVAALDDFLDAVPYNKISAFGGDYCFVDGVYGHLHISRQNVSRVLAKKVCEGIFSADKAIDIAHALYYDNPKRIFQL